MSRSGSDAADWRVVPLAGEGGEVFRSPDPEKVHLTCPSLTAFPGGRLVAAVDQAGPGVKKLQGAKGRDPFSKHWLQGKVLSSTDHGETWSISETFPFSHPCLFRDGASLYLVGHRGDIQIMKSSDGGGTWGRPSALSSEGEKGRFSHSPSCVLACGDYLYMATLRLAESGYRGDPVSVLSAEIWRARCGADLADRRSWVRGEATKPFRDLFHMGRAAGAGLPFCHVPDQNADRDIGEGRWATNVGWQEPQMVHIADPGHVWHDPSNCVLHLVASLRTNRGNLAVLCRVQDRPGESIRIEMECTPAGTPLWLLPMPGGQQKFALRYDETSKLFWLVSNLAPDSMRRTKSLPAGRPGLACEDCRALQLCFSRNLVDWQFAGLVVSETDGSGAFLDCAVDVRGNDLHVIARCSSRERRNLADTDTVRLYTVPHFRDLAY